MTFSELKALKLGTDREWARFIRRVYSAVEFPHTHYVEPAESEDWFPEEPIQTTTTTTTFPPAQYYQVVETEPAWVKRLEDKLDILLEEMGDRRNAPAHFDSNGYGWNTYGRNYTP